MSYSGVCDVYNGDTLVGSLTRLQGQGNITFFEYNDDYHGPALSPELPRIGDRIQSTGLHPFFCNLISEGWLKAAQEKIIEQGHAPSRYEMLAYFGGDCIGAMRIVPQTPLPTASIQGLQDLSERLAGQVHALIPGVQPKVLAVKDENGKYTVSTKDEASTHIAKLDPHDLELRGILETEYVTTWLSRLLLPDDQTSEVELTSVFLPGQTPKLQTIELKPALLIERFDRTSDGTRIEMYEFNQLLGKATEHKYDGYYKDMADFIKENSNANGKNSIRTNSADVEILFKRIIVSILLENADTHFKNFALMRQGEEFRLTPNYDLVSTSRYKKINSLALAIGANTRKFRMTDIKAKDIIQLATDFEILSPNPTLEERTRFKVIIDSLGARLKEIANEMKKPIAEIGDDWPGIKNLRTHPGLQTKFRISSQTLVTLPVRLLQDATSRWEGTFGGIDKVLDIKAAKAITNPQKIGSNRPESTKPTIGPLLKAEDN